MSCTHSDWGSPTEDPNSRDIIRDRSSDFAGGDLVGEMSETKFDEERRVFELQQRMEPQLEMRHVATTFSRGSEYE